MMINLFFEIADQFVSNRHHTLYGMAETPSQNTVTINVSREVSEAEEEIIISELEDDVLPADEIDFEFEVIK